MPPEAQRYLPGTFAPLVGRLPTSGAKVAQSFRKALQSFHKASQSFAVAHRARPPSPPRTRAAILLVYL